MSYGVSKFPPLAKTHMGDPSERPSLYWLRNLFKRKPLRMSPRLAQLEGDLFDVRAELEEVHRKLRKLSGKVYRGVALGETAEAVPDATGDSEEIEETPQIMPRSKQELYQRAALLRGRH